MGDEVRLSSDVAEDKKIKDAINSLYESQDLMESLILDPSYKTKLETFLHGKGDLQKLKLAFLFGQLAKRGVLGYEHGTSNRANTLFYQLSYACYQSVSVKSGGLEEFEDLYRDGECIEAISNGIMVRARRSQPEFLQSIWKRNSNT